MRAGPDGPAIAGGATRRAVQRLPAAAFAAMVGRGPSGDLEEAEARRHAAPRRDVDAAPAPSERPVVERPTVRACRDMAFRREVRAAEGFPCAMSGPRLADGGGRPEVRAARIVPVEHRGGDGLRSGRALSGMLRRMFDRGLVAVAQDGTILVSRNRVPQDVVPRLVVPDPRLRVPVDPRRHPHPADVGRQRARVFGRRAVDAPLAPAVGRRVRPAP
jgi:putative restriction endonuclease